MLCSDYLPFLLKVITILIAAIIFLVVMNILKKKKENNGLIIKNLAEKFYKIKLKMAKNVFEKKKFKELADSIKFKIKNIDKNAPKTFVLNFNGNIKATAVDSLKREITAILSVASKDDKVFLILESPGGTIIGYGLASAELSRIRSAGIELIISVDKVAASGGYMMACIANKIIAAPSAIIGSIGVIAQTPNFNRFLNEKGVDFEQITSGKYKRTVTMFGKNTDEDRQKLKSELDEMHEVFKDMIKFHRPIVDIEKVATGEYWLAIKAKELMLVDELITSQDYLMKLYDNGEVVYSVQQKGKKTNVIKKFSNVCDVLMERLQNFSIN
ncbi:SohB-like S49 family peptidase [Candidatus Cyrtobacter comes]|uniref:SohB-like S49 family peptidase n=1 Tax=Candidatus Cyrtobacter comes TaxID=675776 RepID=A0ABU5L7R5_9RICK|nr:protease SohB [Candidatus Cyrtobacter comes]MDZ5762173.1 SohB-like S49 family peptidase [Candidatus Cyrtobacter comes]